MDASSNNADHPLLESSDLQAVPSGEEDMNTSTNAHIDTSAGGVETRSENQQDQTNTADDNDDDDDDDDDDGNPSNTKRGRINVDTALVISAPDSFHHNELPKYEHLIAHNDGGKKRSSTPWHLYVKNGDLYERIDLNDAKRKAAREALRKRDAFQKMIKDPSSILRERQRIECVDNSFSNKKLQILIDEYPKELAFSLLLCTLRFPGHSEELMDKIFNAIKDYSEAQINYCILKFWSDMEGKEKTADTVIGEALILIFDDSHGFQATPESGNLEAIKLLRQHYPKSILYVDGNEDTPYVRACEALNMKICQYLIKWHRDEKSKARGGFSDMIETDIMSILHTSIDTNKNIVQWLQWLIDEKLLESDDVKNWDLIHRAAQESPYATIEFLIDLCPSGLMSIDKGKKLPIRYLGNRNSSFNENDKHAIKSDEDYAITKLLISKGIVQNGGADTIGGLFSRDPDDEKSYTLDVLLREVGEDNHGRLWGIIDECIKEATDGDHTLNMEDMSAALNKYKSEQ